MSQDYGTPILTIPDYQWEYMREYVRDCANIMGLRDWTANYYREAPDGLEKQGLDAAIRANPQRLQFTIWLPLDWFRKARGDQAERLEARQTVCHELLHPLHRNLMLMHEHLQTNLGDHVWGVYNSIYLQEEERFIDALADWACLALPIPNMPISPPNATGVAIRPDEV